MEETMNATEGIKEEVLHKAEFRKRTNYENAEVYKIFSILYGLVVFIGGVAFSISCAIVPGKEVEIIKYSAEIYFTLLYWVSIIWIMFCITDIIRHRRQVEIPTHTLNRLASNQPSLTGDARLTQNKRISTASEESQESSIAPCINLQLFDACDEDQLNDKDNEQAEITPNKQSTENEKRVSFHDRRGKPNSSDNLARRSSAMNTTRDVSIRRHALDSTEKQDLKSYMHRRRSSIVQHVIGYNYDDNSSVGGLYTRVGIGIFCLGTTIHSGLSILSNFENRSCARWTTIMDDFSRLLFSLIQFFFIFKHSNLIIRAHESSARLAVIHIVVTNLCVWFRMVVIETTSQIMEIEDHEIAVARQNNSSSYFNNDNVNLVHLSSSKCPNLVVNGRPDTAVIHEGYKRLKPLLYPCTIEFSLMCLTLFFLIWENVGKTFTHKISDKASTKNVFMINCAASIKGLFGGMIAFSCTIISIILYAVSRHKIGETVHLKSSSLVEMNHGHPHTTLTNTATISHQQHSMSSIIPTSMAAAHQPFTPISTALERIDYNIVILEVVNLCLLALSLCATMWSLIKIRKFNYRRTTTRFDDVLIIVSLAGTYLYSIFSAFAVISNLNSSTWFAYVNLAVIILELVEGTVHALFILIALRKRMRRTSQHHYPAREMITLLIMLDLSLWFEKTTTTTKHEANPFQLAFYHIIPWSIIAAIATPLQIFFRFHASVCLSHVWATMYNLPTYQAVVSHDL